MNYKYTMVLPFILFLALLKLNGQVNLPDTSAAALYDSLPSHLFPSQVLHNRSVLYPFSLDSTYSASPYKYPGTIPAPLIKNSDFQYLYLDMSMSSTNPLLVPSPDELLSRDSVARMLYDAPIMSMCLNFQQIHPFAVDSGWLFFDTTHSVVTMMPDTIWVDSTGTNYQVFNPDSLAQLAVSDHEVFTSIIRNGHFMSTTNTVSVTFGLPSSLLISNKMPMPNQITMDFADGNGFQNWGLDQAKTIHYNFSQGVDDNNRILRLRFHFGNHVIESRMRIRVTPNIREADDVFYSNALSYTCQVPRNGFSDAKTKVSIRYGNPQKELRKPVVLVEGFETSSENYGDLTYVSLQNGIIDNTYLQHLNGMKDVFDTLVSLGYDVVYVDLEKSRRHIQRHSLAVVKILQHLNQELMQNGSDEQLVVIGASMGGLIVRHALKTMENANCCHNTRIYGTFDTPHQGAHIPLGIQHMAKAEHQFRMGLVAASFVNPVTAIVGLYALFNMETDWSEVLNSPAAHQMLVDHINSDASIEHQSFMQEMEALGHPDQARRIAIISGSEEGLIHQLSGEKAFVDLGWGYDLPHSHQIGYEWSPISFNLDGGHQQQFDVFKWRAFSESRSDRKIYEAAMNPAMFKVRMLAIPLILLTHGSSVLLQTIAYPFGQLPSVLGTPARIFIEAIQLTTNGTLLAMHLLGLSPFVYHAPSGTPHYSESPGGLNNTPESIADKVPFMTAPNKRHTFVPSVSALDINIDSLMMNIESQDVIEQNITPFQSFWAPGRNSYSVSLNQLHCDVTQPMYHWLAEQIDQEPAIRDAATGNMRSQLDTYFNYGRPNDINGPQANLLHPVEVIDGGQLFINHSNFVGFNPSQISGTSNSHFCVSTFKNCDTNRVVIRNGGLLKVGLSMVQNTGELVFESGSILEVDSGANLVVDNGSTLIIKPGAALEIHPGARIFLNGADAKLVIAGKVILHPRAILTYASETADLGVLVFDQPHWNDNGPVPAGENWSIGADAKLIIKGNASQTPTVILKHPLNPYDENRNRLAHIDLDAIDLKIDSGMYANISADSVTFVNVDVAALTAGKKHLGVQLWGKSSNDVLFKNNQFADCYRCLKGYQLGVQQPLAIDSCAFSNSDMAMEFENGNFALFAVDVQDCQVGLASNRALGQSQISHSSFDNVNAPIRMESESSAALQVNASTIENTASIPSDTAIYHHSVGLRMMCTYINNYNVGVDCRSAVIDMADDAMNHINATLPILLTDANGLLLKNGENIFGITPTYVSGSLDDNALVTFFNQKMDARNNSMPHSSPGIGVVQFNNTLYDLEVQSNYITSACNASNNGSALPTIDGWIGNRTSGITVVVDDNPMPFELALDASFSVLYGEDETYLENHVMEVLDEVMLVLNQGVPQLTSSSNPDAYVIAKVGYSMALDLLRKAYMYDHLEVVFADPFAQHNTYIQAMNTYITDFSSLLPISSQYDDMRADYEILRAHLFRLGHHHDDALSALGEVTGNVSQRNLDRRNYWQCVIGWEREMLIGNISEGEFMEEFWNCNTLYSPYVLYGNETDVQSESEVFRPVDEVAFYPNPTSNAIYMRTLGVAHLNDDLFFDIATMDGRTVKSGHQTASYVQRIDLEDLPAGIYVVTLKTPYKEYNQRIVKH